MLHEKARTVALCLLAIGARPVLSHESTFDSTFRYQLEEGQTFESVNDNCATLRHELCTEPVRTTDVGSLHKGVHLELPPHESSTDSEEDRNGTEPASNVRKVNKGPDGRYRTPNGRFAKEGTFILVEAEETGGKTNNEIIIA